MEKIHRIEYTKRALKYLLKMPSDIAEDIRSSLVVLKISPRGDVYK